VSAVDEFATLSDEELLRRATESVAAFGEFYERHESAVGAYFMRRAREPELAADLTAETFAEAFVGLRQYRADGPPVAWLFGIAGNLWRKSLERRRVADTARRKLGITTPVDDDALRSFERLVDEQVVDARLDGLPDDQAQAVRHRVLDDATYEEVARRLRCSPSLARQRVSRGLRALRAKEQDR
jgi:RNA polymerase sigma factor (sigma-70 family)